MIEAVNANSGAQLRLASLVRRAFDADVRLERAIRAWAAQNEEAAQALHRVDDERTAYLADLLKTESIPPKPALDRARFIYWAYLGRAMTKPETDSGTSDVDIESIVELFLP